jgi:hypothetical protein
MLKKTVLIRALSIAFGAAALGAGVMAPALAQSSASGNIFGTVDAPAGASVNLTNTENGLKRSVAIGAGGRYQVTALPPGHYKVELVRDGKVVNSTEVDVLLGQGADASFGAAAVQQVQVTGRRSRIDVSNTNNGAVFTAKELARLPVQNNLTAVILLAPNTTKADSAYPGGTSMGGGGASENAYYINGLPVTNPLSQLGASELPFGAIAQASVITGGFGAEFGRSIGGVLNVVTKSGTNNWEMGASASIMPNVLRSKKKNIYYEPTTGEDNLGGKVHFRRDTDDESQMLYGAYVGGPLVQDKLFMFLAADQTETKSGIALNGSDSTTLARDGWRDRKNDQTRYLAKFDWNISDNHRLEWTSLGDTTQRTDKRYGFDINAGTRNNTKWSELSAKNPDSLGSESNSLKYVGQWSDDLTFTTLYGKLRTPRSTVFEDYDVNGVLRSVASSVAGRVPALNAQNLYTNYQKYPGNWQKPGSDQMKAFRADLEYKLGAHTLRAGLDDIKLESENAGLFRAGGGTWSYKKVAAGKEFLPANLSGGRPGVVGNFGGYGTQGYYATLSDFSSVTSASARQSAQYVEDRWQVTKNVLLTLGVRNDSYSNTNGDGAKFIDVKNLTAPRLAASWDVNGDASLKVFGSAGRYYLQLPTGVAARAASRSTLTSQDYTYTGIDGRGQPTGLVAINTPISPDNEYGQAKDPRSVVVKDLKPNYQDEVTLGFERAYSPSLNFGAKATYRKLGAGIDDSCDTRGLQKWADDHQVAYSPADIPCFIFNPGEAAAVWLNGSDGSGRYVNLSAAEMGFPKIERTYKAVDLFAEHPLRNGWYGKVNYTWSRSKGNMEGQTRSDTGQTDVGTTAAWDFPEFARDSSGVLPNDRTHQLKLFGFYELNPEWSVGGNALVQSGRPKVCLGTNEVADAGESNPYGGPGYGAEYFWCAGHPAPRGSLGRLPVEKRLDLNVVYRPASAKGLALKAEVFNVFNAQTVLARQEVYDDGGAAPLANYGEARTTASPRSVRLTVEYNHRF